MESSLPGRTDRQAWRPGVDPQPPCRLSSTKMFYPHQPTEATCCHPGIRCLRLGAVETHRTPSREDRAEIILRQQFVGSDTVSRVNAINALAGLGQAALPARRQWAEAWQLLQRAGFICREPEAPKDGDWWFITASGASSLQSDFAGSLQLALSHP